MGPGLIVAVVVAAVAVEGESGDGGYVDAAIPACHALCARQEITAEESYGRGLSIKCELCMCMKKADMCQ